MSRARHTTTATLLMLLALLAGACGGGAQPAVRGSGPTATARVSQAAPTPTEARSGQAAGPTAVGAPTAAVTAPTAPDVPKATEEPEPPAPTATTRRAQGATRPKPKSSPTPTAPMTAPEPTATQAPAETVGLPVRFFIDTDKVKVDAQVEHVGFAPGTRAMDVPKKWEDVAWFEPGYRPGSKGNAVIAGHFDSDTGPAVFYKLKDIEKGDIISVEDDKGKVTKFRVRDKQLYYDEDAPLYEIFGPSDEAHLNLITCDGEWNPETKRYDQKLVVFADKIGEQG